MLNLERFHPKFAAEKSGENPGDGLPDLGRYIH
jgi:hypothetical protein